MGASNSLFSSILHPIPEALRQQLLHPPVMDECKKNIEKDFVVEDNKAYSEPEAEVPHRQAGAPPPV